MLVVLTTTTSPISRQLRAVQLPAKILVQPHLFAYARKGSKKGSVENPVPPGTARKDRRKHAKGSCTGTLFEELG